MGKNKIFPSDISNTGRSNEEQNRIRGLPGHEISIEPASFIKIGGGAVSNFYFLSDLK